MYGTLWTVIIVAFALHQPWAWWGMLAMAVGSLWYLVPGTVISIVGIVLLALPSVRIAYLGHG